MLILLLLTLKSTLPLCVASTTSATQDHWFDWQLHVFDYIVKTFQPSQITLFLPNPRSEEFYNVNYVLKSIVKNVSIMLVDTDTIKANDPIFQHPSFWYPRMTNLYVIAYPSRYLSRRRDVSRLEDIINLMVDIAPRPTRPRCLLLIFGIKKVPNTIVESISSFAWSRKFIDFTTLVSLKTVTSSIFNYVLSNLTVTYHYYNPFLDQHFSGPYNPNVDLLPKKLGNLYGYKLIAAATNNPPYVILDRNETGYPILNHTGANYRTLRILRKAMNFTFELAPSAFEYYTEGDNDSLVFKLKTGEIHLSMNHLFVNKASSELQELERSTITIIEEYTALMPKTLDKRMKTPKDFLQYMILGVGTFFIFYGFIHVARFDKRIWSGTRILEILLNVNIPQPTKWIERYIFFFVTFISFNFSINVVTELTEIQFEPYDDIASNDLKLMSKRGYTPVVLEQFRDVSLEDEILEDEAFKAKLRVLKTAGECAFRLERGEKIVCFLTKYVGKPLVQEHLKRNDEAKMKLIKPYLWSSWKTMMFERGTPFLEGFNSKLQRLRDSGLLERFIYDVTFHDKKSNQPSVEEILNKKIITSNWLIVELLLGYALGLIIFFLEIISIKMMKMLCVRKSIVMFKRILRFFQLLSVRIFHEILYRYSNVKRKFIG